jgi:hypothetical protein
LLVLPYSYADRESSPFHLLQSEFSFP